MMGVRWGQCRSAASRRGAPKSLGDRMTLLARSSPRRSFSSWPRRIAAPAGAFLLQSSERKIGSSRDSVASGLHRQRNRAERKQAGALADELVRLKHLGSGALRTTVVIYSAFARSVVGVGATAYGTLGTRPGGFFSITNPIAPDTPPGDQP